LVRLAIKMRLESDDRIPFQEIWGQVADSPRLAVDFHGAAEDGVHTRRGAAALAT